MSTSNRSVSPPSYDWQDEMSGDELELQAIFAQVESTSTDINTSRLSDSRRRSFLRSYRVGVTSIDNTPEKPEHLPEALISRATASS